MEIQVRLQLLDDEGGNGVRLWAIAQDGSSRRWFKWYENKGTVGMDAVDMRLVEEVQHTPGATRHSLDVRRKLYEEVGIDEQVLNNLWHSAAPTTS